MLLPKRTKYRKYQKGRNSGILANQEKATLGRYKIISLSMTRLRATTIEAVRRVITRKLKRTGQVWVAIHPSLSVTEKPLEVRMGKGKGAVSYWACRVKAGQVLYEIDGVEFSKAKSAWLLANAKLPIKTRFYCSDYTGS